jgi:hypothetical protein
MGGLILLMLLQTSYPTIGPARPPAPPPFAVGERFEYTAKLGMLSLGSASIEVVGIDTVRAEAAWNFRFTLEASNALFKITSRLSSWTATDDFTSMRYEQYSKENGKEYVRDYEIYPDSGFYRQEGVAGEKETVDDPLDDASFLYFIRTTELTVGKTYTFNRYFRPDKGPITIAVLKRETLELPDGKKAVCLVINPVVGDKGTFAKKSNARIWLTDDARRIPVQIKSELFGTITLRLKRIATAGGSGSPDTDHSSR